MADAPDLGSGVLDVGVQVPSSALTVLHFSSIIVFFYSILFTKSHKNIILSIRGGKNFHGRNCDNG